MYQHDEIGREHHRELLREAENARLARRQREDRSRRSSGTGSGRGMAEAPGGDRIVGRAPLPVLQDLIKSISGKKRRAGEHTL